jgi:hypothetical protein
MRKYHVGSTATDSVTTGVFHGFAMVKALWAEGDLFCLTPIRSVAGLLTDAVPQARRS